MIIMKSQCARMIKLVPLSPSSIDTTEKAIYFTIISTYYSQDLNDTLAIFFSTIFFKFKTGKSSELRVRCSYLYVLLNMVLLNGLQSYKKTTVA